MDPEQLRQVVQAAVDNALAEQAALNRQREEQLRQTINSLAGEVAELRMAPAAARAPEIKIYAAIQIRDDVQYIEPLDAVKCLPEFAGAQEAYVSWRQAATAAYHILRRYDGTSRHYQAVIIIRSKIRGPADAVLSLFRRDTNKVWLKILCEKFRDDALRVFISGLKRSLTDVLFSAKPKDMPSALALVQEVESNHERYQFATTFARNQEERARKSSPKTQIRQQDKNPAQTEPQTSAGKNPHYSKTFKAQVHSEPRNSKFQSSHEPMDVDPSVSKVVHPARAPVYQNRRPATYERTGNPRKHQRVNHVAQSDEHVDKTYANAASVATAEIYNDSIYEYDPDTVNFRGKS
ncbi:hypothetical protein KR084_012070, partial [Drosophila pseudotakahashii]